MSVAYEDTGLLALQRNLVRVGDLEIELGYIEPTGGARYESGITVAALAAIHEYGSATTPARSFIRSTLMARQSEITALSRNAQITVINGTVKPLPAMEHVAKSVTAMIRERLRSAGSWATPLADPTDTTVLEETGRLAESLGWRILENGVVRARGK